MSQELGFILAIGFKLNSLLLNQLHFQEDLGLRKIPLGQISRVNLLIATSGLLLVFSFLYTFSTPPLEFAFVDISQDDGVHRYIDAFAS